MPRPDVLSSADNPLSTGKGINYVGGHAVAFSGVQVVTNIVSTLLDFNIGKHYIVGKVQMYEMPNQGADNMGFDVVINGATVFGFEADSGAAMGKFNEMTILIPPYARVQVKANNFGSTAGREIGVNITGRVYGAE